jgi:hypothetical protein
MIKQFQIQTTSAVTRPGVNAEANRASPLKRTERKQQIHVTRLNGFSLSALKFDFKAGEWEERSTANL